MIDGTTIKGRHYQHDEIVGRVCRPFFESNAQDGPRPYLKCKKDCDYCKREKTMGCDSQFDVPKKFSGEKQGANVETSYLSAHNVASIKATEPLQETRPPLTEFESQLRALINKNSVENLSNTPDLILAEYMCACLNAFTLATRARERWYGRRVF